MIEEIVLNYLNEKMGVPAYTEEPKDAPDSYIILEKTGSGESNKIDSATLAIQSYGKTLLQAAELNEKLKEKMKDITDLDAISKAKLNTDYNYTDTTKKKYRYQAVYDFIYF